MVRIDDQKLTIYLPFLFFIVASEMILSNKNVLTRIDRQYFLPAFRMKQTLSLLLVPRLWYGDQSVVLKSHLY